MAQPLYQSIITQNRDQKEDALIKRFLKWNAIASHVSSVGCLYSLENSLFCDIYLPRTTFTIEYYILKFLFLIKIKLYLSV